MAKLRKVRWGRLHEIRHVGSIYDRRHSKPVLSESFKGLEHRLKELCAWRRMHMLPGGHGSPRGFGTQQGIRPSSNLPLGKKLKYIRKREYT